MLHDLLRRVLFRTYPIVLHDWDHVLRIGRIRFYYRGEKVVRLLAYMKDCEAKGVEPKLPPGCKVFVDL